MQYHARIVIAVGASYSVMANVSSEVQSIIRFLEMSMAARSSFNNDVHTYIYLIVFISISIQIFFRGLSAVVGILTKFLQIINS